MRSLMIRVIAEFIQIILFTIALRFMSRAIDEAVEEYRRRARRRVIVEFLPYFELSTPTTNAPGKN